MKTEVQEIIKFIKSSEKKDMTLIEFKNYMSKYEFEDILESIKILQEEIVDV